MLKQIRYLLKKPSLWVVMIGVACVPALYNLSFLTSMWDPYGNVKNLPVAVVNEDTPSEFQGKTMNIGQEMVDSMKEKKSLDFHFVSSTEAEKGLKEGDYYMIVTLPSDLSQKATTLLTSQPEQLEIPYQTSKGHSFVASKMDESAMNQLEQSLSEQITETYTSAVFSNLSQLRVGMAQAADGAEQISQGSTALESGGQTLADGLGTLANSTQTFANGASQLYAGTSSYTDGVHQARTGTTSLVSGLSSYTNGVATLASGANQLNSQSETLLAGIGQLQSGQSQIQALVDGASQISSSLSQLAEATMTSQEQEAQLTSLAQGLQELQTGINELDTTVSSIQLPNVDTEQLRSQLQAMASQVQGLIQSAQSDKEASVIAVQSTAAYQALDASQQAELVSAIQSSPSETATQAQAILQQLSGLDVVLSSLENAGALSAQLGALQAGVHQLAVGANQALPGATTAITNLSGGVRQANQAISQLASGSQQLTAGVSQLQTALASGSEQLLQGATLYTNAVAQLSNGAGQLAANNTSVMAGAGQLATGLATLDNNSTTLLSGTQQLADGSVQLQAGAVQLQNGGEALVDGASQLQAGSSTLADSLSQASQQLSLISLDEDNVHAIAQPVTLSHDDLDNVPTNGVGMAPYMVSVSLMVAALSTNVIFAKRIDGKNYTSRWEWARNKVVINGTIATLASVILYGALHLIGIVPNAPFTTFGMILLASWVFMSLVTALLGWNQHLGSFAALILLLLQLGSSAGTYPIELSPVFFQRIQPYLPMTYTVSGLRQTISMGNHIGHQVAILGFFLIGFMVLGLVIFRPNKEKLNTN